MRNDELHQRTVEVLVKLVDVLDCDELSLLCWHCGVSVTDLMPAPIYTEFKSGNPAPVSPVYF